MCPNRRVLQSRQPVTICDQFTHLRFCEWIHKSFWKPLAISLHGLIECLRRHTIQLRQVTIKHDLHTSNRQDPILDFTVDIRRANAYLILRFHDLSLSDRLRPRGSLHVSAVRIVSKLSQNRLKTVSTVTKLLRNICEWHPRFPSKPNCILIMFAIYYAMPTSEMRYIYHGKHDYFRR